ncbi:MAG: C40 family peptidase [Agathobacter sp.]|nr:C40 family peptidase [Agathobacter sp.]
MKFLRNKKSKGIHEKIAMSLSVVLLLTTLCSSEGMFLDLLKGEFFFASQQELNEVNQELNNLQEEQDAVKAELEAKMEELTDLLADKEILEKDMELTQAAIEQAEIDLEAAKQKEAESYAAMKLRIQYMYENSTQDSLINAIFNANGITDMINRVEYVSQVHKSDRQLLDEYKAKVEEVELLASSLEANMNELLTMQEIYQHQEKEIESAVATLKRKSKNYDSQIASAKSKAQKIAEEIREANEAIASGSTSSSGGSSGASGLTGSSDPSYATGVSGQSVVNFALQYVGYPYRYGGNSLTNGCDCSGFVKLVFANFGITTPRQSQAFKRIGQAVSFENMRAGDIVVYPGHVAIYIGNGKIVEAQSSRAGITCNRSVTCSTITAIRRIL